MAIDEQVTLLRQRVRTWNAWRSRQPEAAVDLSHGALRGMSLRGADLSRADLSLVGARLEGANLFKAIIDGADLTEADLRSVQFLQCPQLEAALNWRLAHRDEDLACGAAIPGR
ncbi:MAG: pentapeptide repeat-containing protein [Proteobacteria bacterium]|nr:pentapeptide repeat-containing protein [Pseudomonadota bacterium]